ncbi:MAG: citramalate synthase [Firmicutes bacterium]|nr:citramalate synthase [Alicyclobacillaceae bacterium]MCL6498285.1 citramalate synthase [Bacillota bacterium]
MPRIVLYDTTLRDGTQRAGISLSLQDKVQIAHLLAEFGIDYIEGGWPASNPKDTAFFQAVPPRLERSRVAAFGSTRRKGLAPEQDPSLSAIVATGVEVATIFGKASRFQVRHVLETDLEENLRMVGESVRFLRDRGLEVIFDAEHYFDGARDDADYALAVVLAAAEAGANWIVLCDTNGGSLPGFIQREVARVRSQTSVPLGIHAHDDAGLAVANSLAAVEAGATMVQGTINGYGERCGNANLCTIWPNLVFKMGYEAGRPDRLRELTRLARTVAEVANLAPEAGAPYVGENAFTHKAGVHVGAVRKHPEAYEHVPPEWVGQQRRVLVSELAGKSNLLYHYEELRPGSPELAQLVEEVKRLEAQGYQFEDAESSMALLVQRAVGKIPEYYRVERFHVSVTLDDHPITEATVRIRVGSRRLLEVGEGDGPVHALDNALRKALTGIYPELAELKLTDYKVRVLDGRAATASTVRVLVRSEFRAQPVNTVGVSGNILEASWRALLDAIDYSLWTAGIAPAD